MNERTMYIMGSFFTGSEEQTRKIEEKVIDFLSGENLKGEIITRDPLVLAEKMIQNPNSAFIFTHEKVPGPIYDFFSHDSLGQKIMHNTNSTLGYIELTGGTDIKRLVYCLNRSGKIHSVAVPEVNSFSRKTG